MSKRDQTTGLPKKTDKQPVVETQQPEHKGLRQQLGLITVHGHSRAEREHQETRLVIIATIATVALVVLVLIGAFVINGLIRPNEAVAQYNGENISAAQFQQRARIERAFLITRLNDTLNDYVDLTGGDVNEIANTILSQEPFATWWNELNVPDQLGIRILEDLVNERIIRAEANTRGLTVTDADIDAKINEIIGYDPEAIAAIGAEPTQTPEPSATPTPFVTPTPSPTPEPTATPTAEPTVEGAATATPTLEVTAQATATESPTLSATEVQGRFENERTEFLNDIKRLAGVGDAELRTYFTYLALRDKLAESLDTAGGKTIYADTRHILVATEEEAQDILAALEAGESFAELARAKSIDTGSGAQGGELGETNILNYVEPFANAIRDAEVGAIVGPVESEFGFHIIQVRSKEEREPEQAELGLNRERILSAWVEEQREAQADKFTTFNNWVDFNPETPRFVYEPR